ncbi:MAG: hypothetical protein NC236_02660 [Mycoplasma sp.]|nr:hypothetical protein [Mycoplasma sp.]
MSNEVYIDFEAISAPISWMVHSENELPYAFSICNVNTGDAKVVVLDFTKIKKNNVFKTTKTEINNILNEWNISNPTFISWNGGLERKILAKLFGRNFKEVSQYPETRVFSAKLSKMSYGYESTKYFNLDQSKISPKAIEKMSYSNYKKGKFTKSSNYTKISDGAVASIIGGYLYAKAYNPKDISKVKIDIDDKILMEMLRHYSLDDVLRMKWISDNKEQSDNRYKVLKKFYTENSKFSIKKGKYKNILNILKKSSAKNIGHYIENKKNASSSHFEDFKNDEFIMENFQNIFNDFSIEEEKPDYDLLTIEKGLKSKLITNESTVESIQSEIDFLIKKMEDDQAEMEMNLFGVSGEDLL